MRTLELMIVFGALMAIVAVVAIAIDWVGKPLRGRRFIPRVYRFADELQPVQASRPVVAARPVPMPVGAAAMGALPAMGTAPPVAHLAPAPPAAAFSASVAAPENAGTGAGTADPWSPNPTVVSVPAVDIAPAHSAHAAPIPTTPDEDWDQLLQSSPDGAISGVDPDATQDWAPAAQAWDLSMPLDSVVGGRRPTPIDKAERFWKTVAAAADSAAEATHFDAQQLERMRAGRAPSRLNPRSGRNESPDLLGLRSASHPSQVQMFWPGDAIDPWCAQ